MTSLHVCPLRLVGQTAQATGARWMASLINADIPVERPEQIAADRHLILNMSDIVEPCRGHVAPGVEHIEALLAFARRWDRHNPLLIHCFAGVSRSTAAAFICACALARHRCEHEIAGMLRARARTATPNRRLVEIADAHLGRKGRMLAAIEAIGRGADCFEGRPFELAIGA